MRTADGLKYSEVRVVMRALAMMGLLFVSTELVAGGHEVCRLSRFLGLFCRWLRYGSERALERWVSLTIYWRRRCEVVLPNS